MSASISADHRTARPLRQGTVSPRLIGTRANTTVPVIPVIVDVRGMGLQRAQTIAPLTFIPEMHRSDAQWLPEQS
jgi:hypothetical protein